ncbi:g998 [Coccomyxa elongata]
MGVWDETCLVCGGPPDAPDAKVVHEMMQDDGLEGADLATMKGLLQKTSWLDRHVGNYLTNCKYGGISEYWEQVFATDRLLEDGKAWMLQSPLHDATNAQRITAVWRPIVAKLAKSDGAMDVNDTLACDAQRLCVGPNQRLLRYVYDANSDRSSKPETRVTNMDRGRYEVHRDRDSPLARVG